MVKLGEVIERTSDTKGDTDIPVYSVTKHSGFVSNYFNKDVHSADQSRYKTVREGEFAYATIHLDEGSIGIAPELCAVSPMYTTFRLSTDTVDPEFLLRFLKSPQALAQYSILGTGSIERRKNISFGAFSRLDIPLPPLDEQRRIAGILDNISHSLRDLDKAMSEFETLESELTEDFIRSGDFDEQPLRSCIESIQSGKSPQAESRAAREGEWGVLKLSAVTSGHFKPGENKALLSMDRVSTRHEVRNGDVLMTRKNTPELVGAVCLVDEVEPHLMFPDLVFRIQLDDAVLLPQYFRHLLMSPTYRDRVRALAGGSAKSMSNISQERLRNLIVPVPPLQDQEEFSRTTEKIEVLRQKFHSKRHLLAELHHSLSTRAFQGLL